MTDQRALFEAAVVERMKESGFLEIEIRTECLVRCDDGYQDEIINAGWHYWNAALATTEPSKPVAEAVKVTTPLPEQHLVRAYIHDLRVALAPFVEASRHYDKNGPLDMAHFAVRVCDLRIAKAVFDAQPPVQQAALSTPPQHVEAHKKLELWFFRDMFESNRLALFSLFGFKAEQVDTMAKQQKSFRHILRNEGAK